MEPSLQGLAEALDAWNDAGRATLTETEASIAVYGLATIDAAELSSACLAAGWPIEIADASDSLVTADRLSDDFGPFRAVVGKPDGVAGAGRLVTNTALSAMLVRGGCFGTLRLARCRTAFEAATLRLCPFDDVTDFNPRPVAAKPRRMVRETGDRRSVPEDMGPWLLRGSGPAPWGDDTFRRWSRLAIASTLRALANEVEQGTIVFRGPPMVRLDFVPGEAGRFDERAFMALQQAAAWVYDNEREAEMRHGLFAAEIARTAAFGADAFKVFAQVTSSALESAKIAYGLNLSQVSRDSLKALADLRKAISDETAKLAESTRSVAGSVAAALFAGLGLLVTRSTTNIPGWLLVSLSAVLALYVSAVVWSGWKFIQVQRVIRGQWRGRLYAFLPEDEYKAMVEWPAQQAENAFRAAARSAMAIAFLLVAGTGAYVYAASPRSAAPEAPAGSASAKPPGGQSQDPQPPGPVPGGPSHPGSG